MTKVRLFGFLKPQKQVSVFVGSSFNETIGSIVSDYKVASNPTWIQTALTNKDFRQERPISLSTGAIQDTSKLPAVESLLIPCRCKHFFPSRFHITNEV